MIATNKPQCTGSGKIINLSSGSSVHEHVRGKLVADKVAETIWTCGWLCQLFDCLLVTTFTFGGRVKKGMWVMGEALIVFILFPSENKYERCSPGLYGADFHVNIYLKLVYLSPSPSSTLLLVSLHHFTLFSFFIVYFYCSCFLLVIFVVSPVF